jgi:hypothetical protein
LSRQSPAPYLLYPTQTNSDKLDGNFRQLVCSG